MPPKGWPPISSGWLELPDGIRRMSEADRTLMDQTMVLYGSNFGDADKHPTDNIPTLLAGGASGAMLAGYDCGSWRDRPHLNTGLSK